MEKFSNATLFRQIALQNLQRQNLGFSETELTENRLCSHFSTLSLGRILLVPSVFGRLSSVFGRLQNPVLLVLSTKSGRLRPSKPSAS